MKKVAKNKKSKRAKLKNEAYDVESDRLAMLFFILGTIAFVVGMTTIIYLLLKGGLCTKF